MKRKHWSPTGFWSSIAASLLLAHGARASVHEIAVPADASADQALSLAYSIQCAKPPETGVVYGRITPAFGRTLRFFLPVGRQAFRQPIGRFPQAAKITVELDEERWGCAIQWSAMAVEPLAFTNPDQERMYRHAPLLAPRKDQYADPYTDVPLALAYSKSSLSAGEIRYRLTLYMTDEDSLGSAGKVEAQMGRYGRRLDIEWPYEFDLRVSDGAAQARWFQGAQILGAGHKREKFKGDLFPGSDHPLIYVTAKHNVFSDHPAFPQGTEAKEVVLLWPQLEVPWPDARERLLVRQPWLIEASDLELRREGRLVRDARQYLYVFVRGKLSGDGVFARFTAADGSSFVSGGGKTALSGLGDDLWLEEGQVAIPIDPAKTPLAGGKLTFDDPYGAFLLAQRIEAYTLDAAYQPTFLGTRLQCQYAGLKTACAVNP